ncbi:MAG: MFS transporter [Alphaproteobacteria bacterium]|nr:MFS transporter [Alphaproteobacteria bacterium]
MDSKVEPEAKAVRESRLFDVFRHRNYRLFFAGQSISLIGFWMQAIAQSWLVYRLTDSPSQLGLVAFAGQAPMLLITPFAGVFADRLDRRRILFVTQIAMMASAGTLAGLTLSGEVHVWHIVLLALVSGTANAFDVPTRQSFTIEMVGRADLPRAITLNSIMFNAARLVGPALAGLLVAAVGEGWCVALNAVSYLAVLASLAMMRVERQPAREPSHPLSDLRDGFVYVTTHPQTRTLLALLASASLFGTSYVALMPVFARDVLHGSSDLFGYLMAAVGAGALMGALGISRLPHDLLVRVPFVAAALFGGSLAAFSQSASWWLSWLLLVPAGFGMMAMGIATNTLIQGSIADAMRGRVMAYYVMSFIGMMPISALISGWVSHQIGAPNTLAIGGTLCVVAAGVAYLRK